MAAIKINSKELCDHIKVNAMTRTELSEKMGRSSGFMNTAIARGSMSEVAYKTMCRSLGVEYGTFMADTTPVTVIPPTDMYRLNLAYSNSKVLVQLMCGDEVVSGAWALVKEPGDIGFIQAISYAAHMMYKFAQQNDMNKGELA